MIAVMLLVANLLVLLINVGVTALTVKLVTEVYKKKTIEQIGKVA